MKPKKPIKRVTTEFVSPDEDEIERVRPRGFEFDPDEESFSQFRSKFGTEGVLVKIYRRTPRGKQYCFHGSPSEIDEEVVRLYHAKQPYAHEDGDYFATCFVGGEPRDSFNIPIAPQIATPGAPGEHGGMAGGGEITRLLMGQIERLESRLVQMQQTEREPLSSLAEAMVKLQSLQPRTELPLDTLMKAIEIGKSISGNADGGEWTPIIKEVLTQAGPALGALVSGIAASRQQGPQQLQQGAEGAAGNKTMIEDVMLKQAFAYLKRKCLAGSDPGLYIDLIIDNRDEATYQRLIHGVLTRDFSAFAALDAEIGQPPYAEFFRFIYDGLRQAAKEGNPVATDTGGKGGDASNAASDGEPRKVSTKKS